MGERSFIRIECSKATVLRTHDIARHAGGEQSRSLGSKALAQLIGGAARAASAARAAVLPQGRVILQVRLVEMLHQKHRGKVIHRPQCANHGRCAGLEETGWQTQVLVWGLTDVSEPCLTRREGDEPRRPEIQLGNNLCKCE